jgi:hypothetical protein
VRCDEKRGRTASCGVGGRGLYVFKDACRCERRVELVASRSEYDDASPMQQRMGPGCVCVYVLTMQHSILWMKTRTETKDEKG